MEEWGGFFDDIDKSLLKGLKTCESAGFVSNIEIWFTTPQIEI